MLSQPVLIIYLYLAATCIDKWLKKDKCCPNCKQDIDYEPVD